MDSMRIKQNIMHKADIEKYLSPEITKGLKDAKGKFYEGKKIISILGSNLHKSILAKIERVKAFCSVLLVYHEFKWINNSKIAHDLEKKINVLTKLCKQGVSHPEKQEILSGVGQMREICTLLKESGAKKKVVDVLDKKLQELARTAEMSTGPNAAFAIDPDLRVRIAKEVEARHPEDEEWNEQAPNKELGTSKPTKKTPSPEVQKKWKSAKDKVVMQTRTAKTTKKNIAAVKNKLLELIDEALIESPRLEKFVGPGFVDGLKRLVMSNPPATAWEVIVNRIKQADPESISKEHMDLLKRDAQDIIAIIKKGVPSSQQLGGDPLHPDDEDFESIELHYPNIQEMIAKLEEFLKKI